jgi:hypothetical protein
MPKLLLPGRPELLRNYLRRKRMRVLGFVGYSASGYRDPAAMLHQAEQVLRRHRPARTLVAMGATPEGIGAVYPLAKRLGFGTLGIVSSQALSAGAAWSDAVDTVFVVPDARWGGFVPGSRRLSPTSAAMVRACHVLVALGGGAVAQDEVRAARRAGKPVLCLPAEAASDLPAADAGQASGGAQPVWQTGGHDR